MAAPKKSANAGFNTALQNVLDKHFRRIESFFTSQKGQEYVASIYRCSDSLVRIDLKGKTNE